jgi:hypothetical protein
MAGSAVMTTTIFSTRSAAPPLTPDEFRLLFTMNTPAGRVGFPAEKLTCRGRVSVQNTIKIMGDKSPKSNQKKSTQKQAQAASAEQKKKQILAAKQAAGKKN